MLRAAATFNSSISSAKDLSAVYSYLVGTIKGSLKFDDLLRSQIVYAVSAFDKLMHDLIRVGMVETFTGRRQPTPRYLTESITIEIHARLVAATMPPAEFVFEQEVSKKLGYLSFQDPDRISEGLSLIWSEQQKWKRISSELRLDSDDVRKKLKLISARRNAIVHESDMHPITNVRTSISVTECADVTDFLDRCGNAIARLVR